MSSQFGFLTLAIKKDYKKAIALSLRIRQLMPGIPIAVVCPSFLHDNLSPFFDTVITEYPNLRGFEHKLYLDKYSPFEKTFFLDADILMIREIGDYIAHIGGVGHAYFEKPACERVFNEAREIAANYTVFKAERLADEDVMGIAMSKLDIRPKDNKSFLGSPWAAVNNSFKIDVNNNFCSYEDAIFGKVSPAIIHFPSMGKPLTYAREMRKIFRKNGLSFYSVYYDALIEYMTFKKWIFMKWFRKTFSI